MKGINKRQEYLLRAGRELGIQVIVPFELSLSSGRKLIAEALVPQLGAAKGMIIFGSYDFLRDVADELIKLGYGYSVYDEPWPNEEYDVESYIEMFSDWGWSANNKSRPNWIR